MSKKEISMAVIRRLPRYYRYLGELLEHDVVRISSKELSEKMNVTASQIRQDLNNFGGFGQQGYGYNVEYLYTEIGKILGLDRTQNMIIIGAGNLGQALANYSGLDKRGFVVKGLFDINPVLKGITIKDQPIRMMDELEKFLANNKIDIAAITIPKGKAPAVAQDLARMGIKAIWNFSSTDLHLPDSVVSENMHMTESLMQLSYRLKVKLEEEAEEAE